MKKQVFNYQDANKLILAAIQSNAIALSGAKDADDRSVEFRSKRDANYLKLLLAHLTQEEAV